MVMSFGKPLGSPIEGGSEFWGEVGILLSYFMISQKFNNMVSHAP
jgi:hypothetical protein